MSSSKVALAPPSLRVALAPLAAALAVRLFFLLGTDRVDVDVLRYWKVGTHLLDVSWNPYQAARLYPYPPVWMWVEAGSAWLARETGISFALLVRLPVLAAELLLVAVLARAGGRPAAWLYALHPVSVLVSSCHGQFDVIALLFVLLAVQAQAAQRFDRAALSLAAAIGLKSFPILLLPAFLLHTPARGRLRWAAFATLPVVLSLVPFAWHDASAVRRELFGYGGVADFGWIAILRALRFLATGALARAEAVHWARWVVLAKAAFGLAYAALLVAWWRARRLPALPAMCLTMLLGFLTLYGALSAQYLLWVVPFGVAAPSRPFVAYTAASTAALIAFYLFLAPGVFGLPGPQGPAGVAWSLGVIAQWLATAAWWGLVLKRETASA